MKQARAMVTIYGMNDKIGNLTFYDSSGQSEFNFNKPYSEKTAELIDKEISNIIEFQYKRAINILEKHKEKLTILANELLDKGDISIDNMRQGLRPPLSAIISHSSTIFAAPSDHETLQVLWRSSSQDRVFFAETFFASFCVIWAIGYAASQYRGIPDDKGHTWGQS